MESSKFLFDYEFSQKTIFATPAESLNSTSKIYVNLKKNLVPCDIRGLAQVN